MKTPHKPRAHETRLFSLDGFEVRSTEGESPHIVGYPIRYNVWSQDLGGFRERIMPGSATKTLAESDIRGLLNHDPNYVLGRNRSGTLALADEDKGVRMDATPPETTWASDLLVSMRRKDIDQGSFGFRAVKDEWRDPSHPDIVKRDGLYERDVFEMQLFDVSVVTFPAFTQTSISARSLVGAVDNLGIDWSALTSVLIRAERGITLTDADMDLLNGSIDVLRSYLPSEPEPLATTPDEPTAGRDIAHLKRLLELEEHELLLTA